MTQPGQSNITELRPPQPDIFVSEEDPMWWVRWRPGLTHYGAQQEVGYTDGQYPVSAHRAHIVHGTIEWRHGEWWFTPGAGPEKFYEVELREGAMLL